MRHLRKLLWFLCCSFATVATSAVGADTTILRPLRILDIATGAYRQDVEIVVAGNRIEQIRKRTSLPTENASVAIINLPGITLVPGLIDSHVHLIWSNEDLQGSPSLAARNAASTLNAGFTTVRSLGAPNGLDIELKNRIDNGEFIGPRMFVAGTPLGAPGGVCAGVFGAGSEVKGAEHARSKVREQMRLGASWIKVCAGGGVVASDTSVEAQEMPSEWLNAIVDETHMAGGRVAAHAHGAAPIAAALDAGVDSIEHGSHLPAALARRFKSRNTWLVPTMYRVEWLKKKARRDGESEREVALLNLEKQNVRDFGSAYGAGVPMVMGTDATVIPHGENARELASLVGIGVPPIEAIRMATTNAAAMLGEASRLGQLRAGFYADIIGVEGEPLETVTVFQRINFVMKDGKVIRRVR